MQLAGSKCQVCGKSIVLAEEGMFCPQCDAAFHSPCAPEAVCSVCHAHLQRESAPTPDPLREAVVPRALRPPKNSAAVYVFLFLFLALLGMLAIHYMRGLLGGGH